MKALGSSVGLVAFILATGFASAQPVQNINPKRHSNLAAAQRLVEQAYNRISAAQTANEFDMEGHAAKAKALLDEADKELKAAAASANKNAK
jgi:cellobiose-specific phosphotransferase system component IIA